MCHFLAVTSSRADLEVSPGDTLAVIGGTQQDPASTGSAQSNSAAPHDTAVKHAAAGEVSEGEGQGEKRTGKEDGGTEGEEEVAVVDTEQGMVVLHPNLLVSGSRVS